MRNSLFLGDVEKLAGSPSHHHYHLYPSKPHNSFTAYATPVQQRIYYSFFNEKQRWLLYNIIDIVNLPIICFVRLVKIVRIIIIHTVVIFFTNHTYTTRISIFGRLVCLRMINSTKLMRMRNYI